MGSETSSILSLSSPVSSLWGTLAGVADLRARFCTDSVFTGGRIKAITELHEVSVARKELRRRSEAAEFNVCYVGARQLFRENYARARALRYTAATSLLASLFYARRNLIACTRARARARERAGSHMHALE